MSAFEKKINERFEKMEHDISSVKGDMQTMKDDIIKEIKSCTGTNAGTSESPENPEDSSRPTGPATGTGASNASILGSIQDRMDRKNNVVFFNEKEGEGNLKDEKRRQDIKQIKDIAEEIGITLDEENILSLRRLGQKDVVKKVHWEEVTVPRLLLVTFTETVKAQYMKNAYKLQFAESPYLKKIGIKHDMSREERKKDAELRKTAKSRQEEDNSGNFLYVVRGPTWDRKIIKLKKARREDDNLQAG